MQGRYSLGSRSDVSPHLEAIAKTYLSFPQAQSRSFHVPIVVSEDKKLARPRAILFMQMDWNNLGEEGNSSGSQTQEHLVQIARLPMYF